MRLLLFYSSTLKDWSAIGIAKALRELMMPFKMIAVKTDKYYGFYF